MLRRSAFKTPEGEAAFRAAYDAVLRLWPVPFEEREVTSRFGRTHVVVTGPTDRPPLVLLHGYMATLTMWAVNIESLARDHRVYAIDVMGQPSLSIPDEPIRSVADYRAWLTETLNGLGLDRISLVGMSFGGWLALLYAVAAPDRVENLVLLSPGGLLPVARQFIARGMLMVSLPTRMTVSSMIRWAGFSDEPGEADARPVLHLMHMGLKHFRIPRETMRVMLPVLTDRELRSLRMPVLLLMGDREVIYDPTEAMARARRLIPDLEADLLPGCSHDMCLSRHGVVDARVLDFLRVGVATTLGPR